MTFTGLKGAPCPLSVVHSIPLAWLIISRIQSSMTNKYQYPSSQVAPQMRCDRIQSIRELLNVAQFHKESPLRTPTLAQSRLAGQQMPKTTISPSLFNSSSSL